MPLSDATASTAPSQGQLEEELLIYGQCYSNPSTTCLAPPNHWQHRGVISHSLSPGSLPLHRLPLGDSVSFPVCLFVCICLSLCWLRSLFLCPPCFLAHRQTNTYFLCLTQANPLMRLHKSLFSPTLLPPTLINCSDDANKLINGLLVNMINSTLVQSWAHA